MRLTRRGQVVAIAAPACWIAGWLLGYPVLRVLAGAGAVAVVLAVILVGRVPAVVVERTVAPERVGRGEPALARLVVRNPTGSRRPALRALDRVGAATTAVTARALGPRASAVHHYELSTERRGRLQVGPLTLVRRDPFGLAARSLGVGEVATLWVHPRRHPVHPSVGVRARHHHDGPIVGQPLRGSMDLRRLREYVVGDEMRHLHWKATARTGQLMVREYLDPAQPRLTVVLDTRPDQLSGAGFEDAAEIAASLLCAARETGQRVRLCTPAGLDAEAHTVREVLDRLCDVERERAVLDPTALHGLLVRRSVGGSLVVLTGAGGTGLAAVPGLTHAYSTVTVFAPGAGPDTVLPAGVVLIDDPDPASAVRTWNVERVAA